MVIKLPEGSDHRGHSGSRGSADGKGGKEDNRKYWIAPFDEIVEHMNAWKNTSDGYAVCSWCWEKLYKRYVVAKIVILFRMPKS